MEVLTSTAQALVINLFCIHYVMTDCPTAIWHSERHKSAGLVLFSACIVQGRLPKELLFL